jgi:hypothetical protein
MSWDARRKFDVWDTLFAAFLISVLLVAVVICAHSCTLDRKPVVAPLTEPFVDL